MEKLRRTMMSVPDVDAAMLRDAPLYDADSIIFDLEDAVSPKGKDAARTLVHFALKTIDCGNVETVIRIDALEQSGEEDIEAVVSAGVNVIRLPKIETAQEIIAVDKVITKTEEILGCTVGITKMMAAIESTEGVLSLREIAQASSRIVSIVLGAEDYVMNMKTKCYPDGQELSFVRSMILHAARTAGMAAIDTVYSDVENMARSQVEMALIKQPGFDGRSVINPRRILAVYEIYTLTKADIQHAKEVIWAIEEADFRGSGAISLDGKMISKPIVKRAKRVIALARVTNLLSEEE